MSLTSLKTREASVHKCNGVESACIFNKERARDRETQVKELNAVEEEDSRAKSTKTQEHRHRIEKKLQTY